LGCPNRNIGTTLSKFNDPEDRFNGMGITIHDIYFQRIVLLNFRRYQIGWEADILFEAQDHFGLGREDITKKLYQSFRFFGYGLFFSDTTAFHLNLL
jgi:hypothetical protein